MRQRPRISMTHGERIRTQRLVNVRLLLASSVTLFVLGAGGYLWYSYRTLHLAGAKLQRAAALEHDEQWPEAAVYLRRYLQFQPNDVEARIRLVEALERSVVTRSQRRNLVALLYETTGMLPDRPELRLKLAQQLLELGEFVDAEAEVRKLDDIQSEDDRAAAQRIIAMSLAARARPGGLIGVEQAATALAAVLAENPADAQVASILADFYRRYPEEVGVVDAAAAADAVVDALVAAAPRDADARLARYFYRRRHSLPERRHDLDALLAEDPDHLEALLLSAEEVLAGRQLGATAVAEAKLQRVVVLAPTDPRGHLALARLHSAIGDPEQAVSILTEGRARLESKHLEYDQVLAGLLLQLRQLEEAGRIVAECENELRRRLPELSTAYRIRLENANRLLRARVDMGQGRWAHAARELTAVIASTPEADLSRGATELLQARALLATVMGQLQRQDLAATYWVAVANQVPLFMDAGWKAGVAYLEAGRPTEAIEQLERYVHLPEASVAAWASLVQAQLQKQLRLAASERNWSEFLATLEQARQRIPLHPELVLAEAFYEGTLGTENSRQRAIELLRELEKLSIEDSALWARLVMGYQQLDALEDAMRALRQFEELESELTRRAALRAVVLARADRIDEALEYLVQAEESASGDQRIQLQLARARLLLSTTNVDEAHRLVAEFIEAAPQEPQLLKLGIELSLMRRDLAQAKQWEDALGSQTVVDDFDWRYLRARRLIEEYAGLDTAARGELGELVESLRSVRPSWYPVVALAARHAELQGNTRRALDQYQLAIELGDARPQTLERLVAILHTEGRYSEAETYLSRMSAGQQAYGRADSLAIAAAVRENRLHEAIDLADKAVERGTDDPMHHVWLAGLLSLDGRQEEAEEKFRIALERFPKDSRVWNGWFSHLVRTGQHDLARAALMTWHEEAVADESTKRLGLARGYELLGDTDASQEEYRRLIALDARNTEALFRLGRLLLRTDTAQARELFERVLRMDASHDEARRHLATLLAVSGDQDEWNRAVVLLASEGSADSGPSVGADDRLRAILISRRGRNREERLQNYETARQILLTRLTQAFGPDSDVDRILLAGVFEQEAILRPNPILLHSARDAMRPLVDRSGPPVSYLVQYVEYLLRHLSQPAGGETQSQFEERREVFAADAHLRIDELEEALGERASADQQILPVALRARLASAQERDEEAQRLLAEFSERRAAEFENESDEAKFYLQLGGLYSMTENHAEAEKWYRRLAARVPHGYVPLAQCLVRQGRIDEAIDVCLKASGQAASAEVATLLAQLLTAADSKAVLSSRAEAMISEALEIHNDNIALLMSAAVQKVTEDDNAEAIRLFRRVVEIDASHTLALNNLATLLAEKPNQLHEARRHIEHAIGVAGRHPALLDTWGTILARLGEHERAVVILEEAVAGAATDPRFYFHLAVAYQQSGRADDAREMLKVADQHGLDRAILTRGDRELLASMKNDLLTGEEY